MRGTGRAAFAAILLLIVLGLAAYLLPKMFANPDDQQIQVPRLAGLTVDQARAKIVDAGFAVGNVERAYSQKVKPNRVIDQNPAADSFADKATQISITVSIGTRPTTVPSNIIGQPRAAAETMLQDAHLNGVFKKVDSDQPKGTVVATDPTPGTKVARDSDVNVSISRGPTEVPDVVGKTAYWIATNAGVSVPENTKILLVKLEKPGREYPLSLEKLSPCSRTSSRRTRSRALSSRAGCSNSAASATVQSYTQTTKTSAADTAKR